MTNNDLMRTDDFARNHRRRFDHALDVVELIGRLGLVMVPRAPTGEMCAAGAETGNVTQLTAHRIYKAMIDARI